MSTKLLKYGFAISILINSLLGFKHVKRIYWEVFEKHSFVTYNYERDKLFEVMKTDTTDIVFLGNSITQHYEIFEFLNNPNVRNRGIGGETTIGALQRLETITKGKPDKIFLMLGVNDFMIDRTVSDILITYEEIIKTIQKESPTTTIVAESVLPVSKYKEEILCSVNANEKIIKLNEGIKAISKNYNITYLDLHKHFMENGGLNLNLSVDGIHINGNGYHIMSEIIKPYLNE